MKEEKNQEQYMKESYTGEGIQKKMGECRHG